MEEFKSFFLEADKFIKEFIDPWVALNKLSANLMIVPLVISVLAAVWGIKNILQLIFFS